MSVLSVDPGDSTGFALWDGKGNLQERWICSHDDAIYYLANAEGIEHLVVEDFRLRQGKAIQQSGSKMLASQVIGACRLFARMHKIPIHIMSNQAADLGAMHSGIFPPSNHKLSHDIDAYNLGFYWFEQQGILRPVSRV